MRLPEATMRDALPEMAGSLLAQLRARAPRVHCITNAVAQNFTANALLAAGCVPSMTMSVDEIGGFVASAHGLLVNLGTLDPERREATSVALDAAHQHKVPWILDPVFVDRSPGRLAFARALIARGPRVVRLNHREFEALAETTAQREHVMAYARETRTIIAMSGATDLVTDGTRAVGIGNGHALMAKVTAMGCAGSALVGGFLAVEPDALRAAAAALLMLGVAGEVAARQAQGPGSFAVAILDALNTLDAPTLIAHAKVA